MTIRPVRRIRSIEKVGQSGMARRAPIPVDVESAENLTERLRRIVFSGFRFDGRPAPASHLPLWFNNPNIDRVDRRVPKRTFTPRHVDTAQGHMAIDFVLHGSGLACEWALAAEQGRTIWAGAVRGGYEPPPDASFLVLIGDESAIPAIGTILEAAPAHVRTCVILEVVDEFDERPISDARPVDPIWLHRGRDTGQTGQSTLNLLRELSVPHDAYWWIAGEREAIRAMRDVLVDQRSVPKDRYSINAYWRLTATDPRQR